MNSRERICSQLVRGIFPATAHAARDTKDRDEEQRVSTSSTHSLGSKDIQTTLSDQRGQIASFGTRIRWTGEGQGEQ